MEVKKSQLVSKVPIQQTFYMNSPPLYLSVKSTRVIPASLEEAMRRKYEEDDNKGDDDESE
ncbi:hypothetical protein E2C01_055586 [Portunus trituberculatus]|uniref:Uncharacterized protein n=1 Tax=Portunus trituberculatus TaxID=210409 RepID=A0A5B7GV66_PORTR|nr:hypothetical protein [Portunus trituberculatus]